MSKTIKIEKWIINEPKCFLLRNVFIKLTIVNIPTTNGANKINIAFGPGAQIPLGST